MQVEKANYLEILIILECKMVDGLFVGKDLKETFNGKVKEKRHPKLHQYLMHYKL